MNNFLTVGVLSLSILLVQSCVSNKVEKPKPDPKKVALINTQLAVKYMAWGNDIEAEAKLRQAIAADPTHSEANRVFALLHQKLDRNGEANDAFLVAVQSPENAVALYQYGRFKCGQGDESAAQLLFRQSQAVPTFKQPWLPIAGAGECALKNNKMQQAEQFLRQALKLNPNYSFALLEMADIEFRRQNYVKTDAYISRLGQVSRHSARSLWLGVQAARQIQDKNAIASYSLTLKNKFPDSKEAQLLENQ